MRRPLKSGSRSQTSTSISYPAPVGGWNARDALAAMPPTDAVDLENFFPKTSYVEVRGGKANHLTGISGTKTLAVYNAINGTSKMFAINSVGVYDASSAGAVGASVATVTNAKFQQNNFGDGTNNYLMLFNGVDKPLYYDGSTWISVDAASSPALTGLTTTKIVSAFASKGRMFFIEKDSLSFWYLAAGAAGGALTEFPLDGVAKHGGYLVAGSTWTFDGGDGIDDAVVLVTSEGEVIVYRGTNPSVAASWLLVGVFYLGRPLGRRCLQKYGGDLVLLTQNGAFPLSAALQSSSIDRRVALTNKIENAFNNASRLYESAFGWEVMSYPAQSAIIFNVPIVEGGEHEQYVMNTITKAWCKFKEWDAETFAIFDGELYFAEATKVVKAWTGHVDGSSDIVAYGKSAFSYFNRPGEQKQVVMYRPVIAVDGTLSFLTDIDVDFSDTPINGTATYTPSSGAQWDISLWDVGYWAAGLEILKNWTSPESGVGFCASGKVKIASSTLTVQWIAHDFVFKTGGIL